MLSPSQNHDASKHMRSVPPVLVMLVKVQVAQSCPALCNPMDYTVRGILQARILEWGAFPFSRGSSQPRKHRWILYQLSYQGSARDCYLVFSDLYPGEPNPWATFGV